MPKNRRQAFRCTIAELDARALLRVSEGEITVRVVDESASGFGIESDRKLAVREGELAGLTTQAGQSICRVIRVEHDDAGKTSIGLQRVNEIADRPETASPSVLLARRFGRSVGSVTLLIAFGLGLGFAAGFAKFGSLPFLSASKSSPARPFRPGDPGKRAAALTRNFHSFDDLKSRQFVKTLNLTNGQQRKIDTVVDQLMLELATMHVDRTNHSPEACSHMGMLMVRRAWHHAEGILTPDQMGKWDAILDGKLSMPGTDQAGL
jgi:hypothetical protein